MVASPVRGRVAVIAARDGEFVRAGQEIAVVQDCSRPLVRAQLGQSTYRALRLGTPARFTRADGQEAAGQVVRLEMPRSATGDLYEATIALAPARRAAADSTEGSPAASVPVEWESSCQAGLLGSMHFQR